MIEKVEKVNILALKKDKDKILNQIFCSQKLEIKVISDDDVEITDNTFDIQNRYANVISFLEALLNEKQQKITLTPSQIVNTKLDDKKLFVVEDLIKKINDIDFAIKNLDKQKQKFIPYINIGERLSGFCETKTCEFFLGKLKNLEEQDKFESKLNELKLISFEKIDSVYKIVAHKKVINNLLPIFTDCQFEVLDELPKATAQQVINKIDREIDNLKSNRLDLERQIATFGKFLSEFKVAYDYYNFKLDKLTAEKDFKQTDRTFFVTCYLRQSDENDIKQLLSEFSLCYEFEPLNKDDDAPTVLKNNVIVKPFEFITNTYSVPSRKGIDPNVFVMIFFSIFFGFVMADIGYGILFVVFCAPCYFLNKSKSLMGILSISGLFCILFGCLFGSFFGLTHTEWVVIPKAIIPDPTGDVYLMLALCLGAGIVQIATSFVLKGVLLVKEKRYFEAIFSGFIWVCFFAGVSIVGISLLGIGNLQNIGLIVCVISLLATIIGEIFVNRGINRLTKPFSSLYSIINILSDTLSYARLYGLMLSGAIIASIVNDLASPFFINFFGGIIGIIILLIGHGFNISMGALSAYIHVSRLQYIEFFSRFYEGEGRLFKPFATNFKYINLTTTK